MADHILLETESMVNSARQIEMLNNNHKTIMQNINNLVFGLDQIWKGDSRDSFMAEYVAMRKLFEEFSEVLSRYSKLIDTCCSTMIATDEGVSGRIVSV